MGNGDLYGQGRQIPDAKESLGIDGEALPLWALQTIGNPLSGRVEEGGEGRVRPQGGVTISGVAQMLRLRPLARFVHNDPEATIQSCGPEPHPSSKEESESSLRKVGTKPNIPSISFCVAYQRGQLGKTVHLSEQPNQEITP